MNEMSKKARELTERILEEEKGINEDEIKKKSHKKQPPTVTAGKIYKDNYRIYRVSPDRYSSDYIVQMIYSEGRYSDFELLKPGERRVSEFKNENYRRSRLKIEFQCCYNDVIANVPVELVIEVIDTYEHVADMRETGTLDEWVQNKGMDAIKEIADDECDDWQYGYKPCKNSMKIIEVLEKEEHLKCPEFVKAEIERLERRKLRVREEVAKMVQIEIDAIKKEYDCE